MESHAQSVDDVLAETLSFKLRAGASYIGDRKSSTFHPSGGDSYGSASGIRVIKFSCNSDGWMDPSTAKFFMTVHNTSTTDGAVLKPLSTNPNVFFRRLRVLCNGQIVEDIDNYNRVCHMFDVFQSTNKRSNNDIEGFDTLPHNSSAIVSFTLCSGILNQDKFISLKYAPLVFELELVGSPADCLDTGTTATVVNSTSWKITEPQLKCDIVELDSELQNSYAAHLLSGKSLPIHFSSYATNVQTATGKDNSLHIARAFTRLKSVFVSMFRPVTATTDKVATYFYHPMQGTYNKNAELEFQLQIGSKLFPEYPMMSLAEEFYSLKKTLSIHGAYATDVVSLNKASYMENSFIIGVDCEKLLGASFTGYNTMSGSLLTLRLRNAWDGAQVATAPEQVHTVLHYDAVLNILDTGSQVME